MNEVGTWTVDVCLDGMPQKVATAFAKLSGQLVGAEYTPIAYLGSQVVNGTNYAVLAEQLLTDGKDTKNIVLLIFNEKPGAMEANLVNIERVLESGGEYGGTQIDVEKGTGINKTAMAVFEKDMAGFVGSVVTPFALLGTQIVRGTNFIFAAEVKPVIEGSDVKKVALVTVNDLTEGANFVDLLVSKNNICKYAFTWLG